MHNYYLVWLLMWAFLFLCVLLLNQGFSKKLKFLPHPPLLCLYFHALGAISEGWCSADPKHISFCCNGSETLGRSSVEHFCKLYKATLRINPKLVANLSKVGVCVWTGWTTKFILHHGLVPAWMAVHVLWNIPSYLPSRAQNCFRNHA